MRPSLLLIPCLVLLLSVNNHAQVIDGTTLGQNAEPNPKSYSTDEEHSLKFKSQTVLVQVPAVVTDKSGSHIHNLKQEDFKVLEGGKLQRIATFEEVTPSTTPLMPPSHGPGVISNVVVDSQQPRSITVIALDLINTPFLDQTYARKALIKFLGGNLDAGQALALVVISRKGVKVLGSLTGDPARLVAALKEVGSEAPAMQKIGTEAQTISASGGGDSDLAGPIFMKSDPAEHMRNFVLGGDAFEAGYREKNATEETMRAFLAIALSLSGVPGRKSLIWATGGFPFRLAGGSSLPGGALSVLYERTMQALNDAQISVYPVDIRGITGTSSAEDPTVSASAAVVFGDQTANLSSLNESALDSLRTFAEMTGGRAFFNNNDAASGFRRAADDSSSYYLLGYYLNTHNTSPGWRKLQVQVQRKDAEVRARSGFLVTNATVDPETTHRADIAFALSSPFDSSQISVSMEFHGISPHGEKKNVGFVVHVPAVGVIDEADKNRFDLDFVAQATKKDGKPVGDKGQTVKGTLPADALAKIKAEGIFYKNGLDLANGDYDVRFVVRDNLSGKIGSVTAALTVK